MPAPGRSISLTASAKPPEELKARALRYLARREHSRDELTRKLAPYAESPEILEGTLDWLESTNRLSNQRFAEARAHWMSSKYGAAKIRRDLREKGVSADLAERVASDGNDLDKARAILKRKYRDHGTNREERARRARFLQSRGFSYDIIRAVVADLEAD
jgi:regulatory protein